MNTYISSVSKTAKIQACIEYFKLSKQTTATLLDTTYQTIINIYNKNRAFVDWNQRTIAEQNDAIFAVTDLIKGVIEYTQLDINELSQFSKSEVTLLHELSRVYMEHIYLGKNDD